MNFTQDENRGTSGACNNDHNESRDFTFETVENDLLNAIETNSDTLELFYQPIITLAEGVVAAEALLRWNHPKWGIMKVNQLIHVLSTSTTLSLLSDWVMRHACLQLLEWQSDPALKKLDYLAVNVSSRQFCNEEFTSTVEEILNDTGITPSKLCLELKESILLLDTPSIEHKLRELKRLGVRITLDNYGTGHSSIAEISSLPFGRIKIDRTFIRNITLDDGAIVTETILDMSRHLGLECTAVGIEHNEQLSFLSIRGCQSFQGNYFCPPVPLSAFTQWYHTNGRQLELEFSDKQFLEGLNRRAGVILDLLSDKFEQHNAFDLLYKLHVRESELEVQNKELEATRSRIEKSAELFEQLYQQSPVGYIIINTKGTIRHVNQTLLDSLELQRQAVLDKQFIDFIAPWQRDGLQKEIDKAFRDHSILESEVHLLRSNQEMYIAKVEGRLTSGINLEIDNHDSLLLLSVDDITGLKKTEQELLTARNRALTATRAKSAFLATMSHEIRTPMNAVLGMAELLEDTPLDEVQKEYVTTIRQAGNALLALINDILDISKIEADKLELSPIPFDMELAAHEVFRLMSLQAENNNIELILDYPIQCDYQMIGDAGRIRQILYNLINNAIKFTAKGYVLVKVRNNTPHNGKTRMLITVTDTGIGISSFDQAKLFKSFSQVDSSTTRKYGGTGLGLAICKRLIDMMSGRIGVRSKQGYGSTFWFTITLPIGDKPQHLPAVPLEGRKVLIVDDNHLNLKILGKQLDHYGLNVVSADSGTHALELLQNAALEGHPFEVALIDFLMPNMNGEQLAREIESNNAIPKLPLILLTSVGTKGDATYFSKHGFSGYLLKPADSKTIKRMLGAVLASNTGLTTNTMLTKYNTEDTDTPSTTTQNSFEGKILLVDDVPANQKVAATMLQRLGLDVEIANNGKEAVDLWMSANSGAPYDLIFMDIVMPEMDGHQAARAIRQGEKGMGKRIPIVAMTASASMAQKEKTHIQDMDDCITKPFTRAQLVNILAKWIGNNNTDDHPSQEQQTTLTKAHIQHFDPDALSTLREGLGDDIEEVLPILLDSLDTLIAQLTTAWRDNHVSEIHRIAHSIKSSSATIGAAHLSELARSMEECAKNGKIDTAEPTMAKIQNAHKQFRTALERSYQRE